MSSDLKNIFSNTLAQLLAKFVGAGLTLLTTILIIRISGASLFGDLTKSLVLIAVGFTAIDFGLNAVVVRSLPNSNSPRLLVASLISTRLLLSLLAVLIFNCLIFFLPGGYTPAIKAVFWLGSLAIIFQGLFTSMNAWFQYQENYWSSAISTIGGALVGSALTYYYVLTSPTLVNYLFANTLGYFVVALLAIYLGRQIFTLNFSFSAIHKLLRHSLVLGGILLSSVLAGKLDTVILGVFRSSAEVGEYGFAYRIFDVILVLPVFIMNSVYPKLVKITHEKSAKLVRQSLIFLGAIALVTSIVVWNLAPWILFIRPGLTLSVVSLRLLIVSLPLFFLTAPLMWHQISLHHEARVFKVYLAAAVLNGLLNLWLIPSHGVIAASLTTGITELFILLALLYSSRI